MRKILLVSYSQTGQLTQLAQSFIAPLNTSRGRERGVFTVATATLQKFRENRPLDRGLFQGMGAVSIDEKLMMSEQVGNRSFQIWGNWLIKSGRISPSFRQLLLYIYVVFLVAMILTVVPISAIIKRCLKPLFKQKLAEQKRYFAEPSGE